MKAQIIQGGIESDERGSVSFINDFHFEQVKRFYVIKNISRGFVRAWHAHRREGKYVYVVTGSALVGVVDLETGEVCTYILEATDPKILYIPPDHANGFQSLTEDARVVFFSTSTLEESESDIVRFPSDRWDIWNTNTE